MMSTTARQRLRQHNETRLATVTADMCRRTIPIAQVRDGQTLELKVTMDDLRSVAVVAIREKYLQGREVAERLLRAAEKEYAQLESRLTAQAQALVQNFVSPDAAELAAALSKWTGRTFTYAFVGASASSYMYRNATEPVVDVEAGEIKGKIWFNRPEMDTTIDEIDKQISVPFDAAMRETVQQLAACKAQVDEAKNTFTSVNRLIAELPHRGEQIQSALTTAHITGKLRDTSDILLVLEKQAKNLRLPAVIDEAVKLLTQTESESYGN